MYWYIVGIVLTVLTIAGIVCSIASKPYSLINCIGEIAASICGMVVFVLWLVVAASSYANTRNTATFTAQKEYIESHESANEIEDAALTTKKIELNAWLYKAQYSKERWGGWSLYPDTVLDLEPIN